MSPFVANLRLPGAVEADIEVTVTHTNFTRIHLVNKYKGGGFLLILQKNAGSYARFVNYSSSGAVNYTWDSPTSGVDMLTTPMSSCTDGTHIYTVDSAGVIYKQLLSDASYVDKYTTGSSKNDIQYSAYDGNLYLTGGTTTEVFKYTTAGVHVSTINVPIVGGYTHNAKCVAVGDDGAIYVTCLDSAVVSGWILVKLTQAGALTWSRRADAVGPPSPSQFYSQVQTVASADIYISLYSTVADPPIKSGFFRLDNGNTLERIWGYDDVPVTMINTGSGTGSYPEFAPNANDLSTKDMEGFERTMFDVNESARAAAYKELPAGVAKVILFNT